MASAGGFVSSVKVRLVPPVPPSCRHRCTPELSSVQGLDRRVRGRQGAWSQPLRFIKAFFVLGFILDRVELAENQETMAACALFKKGVLEQFVARSNGSEYLRCSNHGCGYFCAVEDLPSYERVVQLDVAGSFGGREAPLCQHRRPCTLRVSRSLQNTGRRYFVCRDRWPCTLFSWANLEVTLRPLTEQQQ